MASPTSTSRCYPGREKIRVRFRKDGILRTYLELPSNYRNALIAR